MILPISVGSVECEFVCGETSSLRVSEMELCDLYGVWGMGKRGLTRVKSCNCFCVCEI